MSGLSGPADFSFFMKGTKLFFSSWREPDSVLEPLRSRGQTRGLDGARRPPNPFPLQQRKDVGYSSTLEGNQDVTLALPASRGGSSDSESESRSTNRPASKKCMALISGRNILKSL